MENSETSDSSLIIVSNRLPIVLKERDEQEWDIEPGTGGLVTAMAPVLKNRGGVWVGWPGNVLQEAIDLSKLFRQQEKKLGYQLKTVNLSEQEKENFYKGFSNEVLWPLFHDFIAHCNFKPDYWVAYQSVNKKFAEATVQKVQKDSFIWVHDYHLIGLAKILREMGIGNIIAFFLHIPFPPPDIFIRLPWRFQLLSSLLNYNLIGFQTIRDRRNFIQCLRMFIGKINIQGKGQVLTMYYKSKEIRVGVFPISIDFEEFSKLSLSREVADRAWYIHEDFPDRKIMFGIDRLDYSKGIPERLRAFRYALRNFPELKEKISFIQVVVPSRREIPKYADLKIEIERLVGEINGEFTILGWVPVHYMFTTLDRKELLSYYRTSDILFITPLKDGMNLVVKEYCVSNLEENGVLILSEFAGSAAEFKKNALLVNPHDIIGMAEAIRFAFTMPMNERKSHMRKMRQIIKKNDIYRWVDTFLQAAIEKNLDSFPILPDYIPQADDTFIKGMLENH